MTTIQLEFRDLSRATGNPKYEEAVAKVSQQVRIELIKYASFDEFYDIGDDDDEWWWLSWATGNPKYEEAVAKVSQLELWSLKV